MDKSKTDALKQARGPRFVCLLREVYADIAPRLASDARAIITRTGALTTRDVGRLAHRHNLHLKHAFDFLEEQGVLPTGTYELLQGRGLKAQDAMKEAT